MVVITKKKHTLKSFDSKYFTRAKFALVTGIPKKIQNLILVIKRLNFQIYFSLALG